MIQSFSYADTEKLFKSIAVKRFKKIERAARRKLLMLNAATLFDSLRGPPGSHLETLAGNRKGQFSIRINEQWGICFRWSDRGARDVGIVDYH